MLTLICLYNICYFSLSPVAICYHYCVMPTIWSRSKYSTWPKQCLPDHKYQCLPNDQDQCPPNDQDRPHVLPHDKISAFLMTKISVCLMTKISVQWKTSLSGLTYGHHQCSMKNVSVRSYLWTAAVFNETRQCQVLPMDSISVQRNTSVYFIKHQCPIG